MQLEIICSKIDRVIFVLSDGQSRPSEPAPACFGSEWAREALVAICLIKAGDGVSLLAGAVEL